MVQSKVLDFVRVKYYIRLKEYIKEQKYILISQAIRRKQELHMIWNILSY
jgi:hypothetical protein